MDWKKLLNTERLKRPKTKKPPDLQFRPFFEDQDRILFSQPFRRLQAKTQVHPLSDNDHVRTRLTHSIEVGTIGYAIGCLVGRGVIARHRLKRFREDDFGHLVQAACYGHDIGNPPFGHIGELAIRGWFRENGEGNKKVFNDDMSNAQRKDLTHFDGNAQGFRILTQIENYKWNRGGMQLTLATLGAFMKYPWDSNNDPTGRGKFSIFQSEMPYAEEVAGKLGLIRRDYGWCRHPLAYLVETADDICYALIDLEDGAEIGAYPVDRYKRFFRRFLNSQDRRKDYNSLEDNEQRISFLRAKAMTDLVKESSNEFMRNEDAILEGEYDGALLDNIALAQFVKQAKSIAAKQVFSHPKKVYLEVASYTVLGGLLEAFIDACVLNGSMIDDARKLHLKRLMGHMWPKRRMSRYERILRITDFLSGMTDRFALGMYRQLTGITSGGMTPAPTIF